jgi:hypothetical protein
MRSTNTVETAPAEAHPSTSSAIEIDQPQKTPPSTRYSFPEKRILAGAGRFSPEESCSVLAAGERQVDVNRPVSLVLSDND